jgi:macrolide-specific efflux system membrane fusion protein
VAESLRRGGSINKNAVVMTIVAVRPMFVRASVAEADLEKIRPGLGAAVRPTAYPDLKLPGTVARVDSVPSASDSFDARIDVKLDASDKRIASLVPGMSCTAKLLAYVDKRALVLPAKAVFEDELDEDSRYVFVAGKDGKPQKRPVVVGKKGDDKVEIIRGLTEQEEVLLERPKEKTLREEAKPKPADKKEAEKKEPPKKTVEPPKKEADKKDGAKDDRSKK